MFGGKCKVESQTEVALQVFSFTSSSSVVCCWLAAPQLYMICLPNKNHAPETKVKIFQASSDRKLLLCLGPQLFCCSVWFSSAAFSELRSPFFLFLLQMDPNTHLNMHTGHKWGKKQVASPLSPSYFGCKFAAHLPLVLFPNEASRPEK